MKNIEPRVDCFNKAIDFCIDETEKTIELYEKYYELVIEKNGFSSAKEALREHENKQRTLKLLVERFKERKIADE